ncbi:MAG: methylmalonyl-CoA epimerase [Promethearchaeota archaeon]
MKVEKISHIGIAVASLQAATELYEALGLKIESTDEVKEQKVKVAFFPVGDTRIELLEATDPDSPIAKHIENRGEGIHHIALKVDNIEDALDALKKTDIKLIDKEPRSGAHGSKVAFLHPKSTHRVLLELVEE